MSVKTNGFHAGSPWKCICHCAASVLALSWQCPQVLPTLGIVLYQVWVNECRVCVVCTCCLSAKFCLSIFCISNNFAKVARLTRLKTCARILHKYFANKSLVIIGSGRHKWVSIIVSWFAAAIQPLASLSCGFFNSHSSVAFNLLKIVWSEKHQVSTFLKVFPIFFWGIQFGISPYLYMIISRQLFPSIMMAKTQRLSTWHLSSLRKMLKLLFLSFLMWTSVCVCMKGKTLLVNCITR